MAIRNFLVAIVNSFSGQFHEITVSSADRFSNRLSEPYSEWCHAECSNK